MKSSETKQETRTLAASALSERDPCGSRSEKWLIMMLFATLSDKLLSGGYVSVVKQSLNGDIILRSVAADFIEKEFLEVPFI